MSMWAWLGIGFGALLVLVAIHDMTQKRHAVLRNFPIIGHFRYWLEAVGPELRQYIVTGNDEERPFSRDQRRWIYSSAKKENNYFAFGTDNDLERNGNVLVRHSTFPLHTPHAGEPGYDPNYKLPALRVLGGFRGRKLAFQPASIVNTSAMSYGSLSSAAVEAINRGVAIAGALQNTGEGGISDFHRKGGDIIWQIGTGYFGCREDNGQFSLQRALESIASARVKAIEIKLSQGAKPGHGGILPGPKVTPEIAAARGVPAWRDCNSPSSHSAFDSPIELMHFIVRLRRLSGGKPVGFKLCVGHPWEWFAIAKAMLETGITPDFIVVDGAEGGTGAAPIEFVDHVGTPLREGLRLVHNTLVGIGLRERIKLGASGKIISAFDMVRIMALGADWCNSARAFMFAVGCLQAQVCHTGRCPTGVTTQDPQRQKALVVADKSVRVANFHTNTLKALAELLGAAGLTHPGDLRPHHIARRIPSGEVRVLSALFPDLEKGELLEGKFRNTIFRTGWPMARADSFEPAYSLSAALSGNLNTSIPESADTSQAAAH
jgi:glutamate synthase domain-containing protein 2